MTSSDLIKNLRRSMLHVVLETYLVMPSLRRSQKCKKACWGKQRPHFHISADIQLSALSSVVFTFLLCWGKSNLPGLSLLTAFSLPSLFHREYVGRGAGLQSSQSLTCPCPQQAAAQRALCHRHTIISIRDWFSSDRIDFWSTVSLFSFKSKDCQCGLPDCKVN